MDEAKKKQLSQLIILGILIAVAVVAATVMSRRTAQAPAKPAPSAPATDMAKAGTQPQGASSVPAAGAAAAAKKLNPNMWRVFQLSPPRNPFTQQESWYAAAFKKLLPGYPQLQASGFFEKQSAVLPDLNALFGEDVKFDKIEKSQMFADINYNITGHSADGRMVTTINASEDMPEDQQFIYDGDGNQVFTQTSGETRLPNNLDQGGAPAPGALPDGSGFFPGQGMPVAGGGQGDALSCHGVNLQSGKPAALVRLNGTSYLVSVGSDLPPYYRVTGISRKGVEVTHTGSGEKKFIELKPAKDNDAPPSVLRGMNL